jgi:hypothetical protein
VFLLLYPKLGEINIVQNVRSYTTKCEFSTIFRAVKIIQHVIDTKVLTNHTTNVPVFGVRDKAEEVEYLERVLEIRG